VQYLLLNLSGIFAAWNVAKIYFPYEMKLMELQLCLLIFISLVVGTWWQAILSEQVSGERSIPPVCWAHSRSCAGKQWT
jgi:uncharacterized integral membrane protein